MEKFQHGGVLLKPPCQIHGAGVVEAKRNGGLDLLKTAVSSVIQESARNPLPVSGFFLSSAVEADVSY